MKLATKLTAVVMAVVLLFTLSAPAMAKSDKNVKTRAQYAQTLADEGYPAMTTTEFLAKVNACGDFFRMVTGGKFPTEEKINITFDKTLTDANLYVVNNCGVDMEAILRNLPPLNNLSSLIVETFEIDPVAFRDAMFEESRKQDEAGTGLGVIYYFLGCYMSMIDKIEVFAEPTDDPVLYQICFNMVFRDGAKEKIHSGMYINTETGELSDLNGNGMLGLGFNFNFKDMVIYTVVNAWTRDLGFAVIYDVAANAIGVYDYETRRYHFDYDGLEWMIQVWKGTYFYVTNGAEVGIYNRVPGEEMGTFYNCANNEQMMEMTLELSYKDKTLFKAGPQKHWWLTGFHLSGTVYEPASLTMVYSILFPNVEMRNAFTNAVDNEENGDATYTVDGLKVTVNW